MKLHQLQALVASIDHGGIRAAARVLNISQAAVTKALRQLEDEAGLPLLQRRSRGIGLTPAGERAVQRARLVLRQIELTEDDWQQTRGHDHGSIHIGVTPYVTLTVLGDAFAWFRQRYQQVQVHIIDGLMSRTLPRLRDGSLDWALVAADPGEVPSKEFTMQHVVRVRQRVAARQGHRIFLDPSPEALSACEWAHTGPIADAPGNQHAQMFRQAGVPFPKRAVLGETLAALSLIRHGDALGVVPEPLLGHPESRGISPVPNTGLEPSDLDVIVLSQPDVPMTPAAAYFAHCLISCVRAGATPTVS